MDLPWIAIRVNAGVHLEVEHVVVGYAASPEIDVVVSDDNPLALTTTTAIVREYRIPAQASSARRCMGAVVALKGTDLRDGTPEFGDAGSSASSSATLAKHMAEGDSPPADHKVRKLYQELEGQTLDLFGTDVPTVPTVLRTVLSKTAKVDLVAKNAVEFL
ncbi:hypothetical protein HDU86_004734 [Geranomyces michiganensis]|nr:hypothetical protein HDU86_004734 [Geranomyces michiganensis]